MRIDTYTKTILTVVAIVLTVIACSSVGNPESVVRADGPLAGIQTMMGTPYNNGMTMLDTRTGDYWVLYGSIVGANRVITAPHWEYQGRIGSLGGPIVGWEKRWKSICPECTLQTSPPAVGPGR
jgi:hypothetical protein